MKYANEEGFILSPSELTFGRKATNNFCHYALVWGLVSSETSSCPRCCSCHMSAYIPPRDNRASCLGQGGKYTVQPSVLPQESSSLAHRDNGIGKGQFLQKPLGLPKLFPGLIQRPCPVHPEAFLTVPFPQCSHF